MMLVVYCLSVLCVLQCLPCSNTTGRLIFHEPFDRLDEHRWNHLVTAWGRGNGEFQYYRNNRRNSYVKDGALHIRPTLVTDEKPASFLYTGKIDEPGCNMEPCVSNAWPPTGEIAAPIFSARLRTKYSFSFTYGRVVIRAKLPTGDWIWPAIWLLPTENVYGIWPTSGEIDMVESRGNKNLKSPDGKSQGNDHMASTLHFGPKWPFDGWGFAHYETSGPFAEKFVEYTLDWSPESISFSANGQHLGTVTPPAGGFWKLGGFDKNPGGKNVWSGGNKVAPFDQNFFLILNVAVGGGFFPSNWKNGGGARPWHDGSMKQKREFWEDNANWRRTWTSPELVVDDIKVYSLH